MKTKIKIFMSVLLMSIFICSVVVSGEPSSDIEKIKFIHYKDKSVKILGAAKPSQGACFKLFGVKWNSPVTYTIDPKNSDGLSDLFVINTIKTSAEIWDQSTSKEIFNDPLSGSNLNYGVYDETNSIVFGTFSNQGIIAETSIWYSKRTKQIYETDMKFNEFYTWGDATQNTDLMDLQNIATHELGHVIGLGDLYTSACSSATMFGYSDNGEVTKRTLEQSDITGLQKIYGI